jgi:hypothetical protein
MSYDIELQDPVTKQTLRASVPRQMAGGTYAVGGTTELSLNITYNYGGILGRVLVPDGLRSLYGMSGAESIPVLSKAISELGDDTDSDYWKATEGNVKRALIQLRALASIRPDGVWAGD